MLNKQLSEDPVYCSSSFLMYRTIIDETKTFHDSFTPNRFIVPPTTRTKIKTSNDLINSLKKQIQSIPKNKKIALALSGGIDSAILAKLLPENTIAYTFKCVVPGVKVTDETKRANQYAKECKLKHKIIEIYWEDFEKNSPILMIHKGMPIHSIEVQIYKASIQAKNDGVDILIFGESADCLYGGLSDVLSKDWHIGDFIERYSFVSPQKVLKKPILEIKPFISYMNKEGMINVHDFYSHIFFKESINSYFNACSKANIECLLPYANTIMDMPLNLKLVRSGKNKYLIREIFEFLYQGFEVPPKTPMPRPMDEWLENWKGPKHDAFYPNCIKNLSGDQKWLLWSLEKFLNIIDNKL